VAQRPERSDPETDDEVRIPAAPVRSRMRGRAVPLLPRTLGVALVVGFLAFVAGVQFAEPRGTGPAVTETQPSPTESAAATERASPDIVEGRSTFASAFNPLARLQGAGLSTCAGSESGGTRNGKAYIVVVVRCVLAPARQPAQILRLQGVISSAIDEAATRRDGGVAGPDDPDGPSVRSWNYASDGFDGSVYLGTTHTGSNFQVVIILSEERPA
jgi:hypothetical protein